MAARKKCKFGKVILHTELDAKIALADHVRRGKDAQRFYQCDSHTEPKHFHLSSQEQKTERAA